MRPIPFKEANCLFGQNQKEFVPFPALRNKQGDVVCCWRMSIRERLKVLFTGKVWWGMSTNNKPMFVQVLTINKHDLFEKRKEKAP